MKMTTGSVMAGLTAVFLGNMASSLLAAVPIENDPRVPVWRNLPGTTFQKWAYCCASNNPATPEVYSNPNGTPSAVFHRGTGGQGWVTYNSGWTNAADGGGLYVSNVWVVGSGVGFVSNSIPQATAPDPSYKYFQVQYTWYDAAPSGNRPANQVASDAVQVGVSEDILTGAGNSVGGTWKVTKSLWRMPSSRPLETNKFVATAIGKPFYIDAIVIDTVLVNAACPENMSLIMDQGQNTKSNVTYALAAPGVLITNIVCVPPTGSTFALGTTTVNCTKTDLYGYSVPCSFTVTVSLPPAPQITQCADSQTNVLGTGCQVAVPDLTSGVVVTGLWVTLSQSPAAGTLVGPGAHTATITATNDGGSASCAATFMVVGSNPVAINDPMDTFANSPRTINAAKLLINDSHPDGRAVQVAGVTAASTNGGTVTFDGTSIVYTPTADYVGADAFTYTNRDCSGLTATALVVIDVAAGTNFLNLKSISSETVESNQVVTIVAQGVANYSYTLQRAGVLTISNAAWANLLTRTAVSNDPGYGELIFKVTNPPSPSFYRTKYPPAP